MLAPWNASVAAPFASTRGLLRPLEGDVPVRHDHTVDPVSSDGIDMLALAIAAFDAARDRVAAAPAAHPAHLFAPLTEAAWWAVCIDEEMGLVDGYASRRNNDAHGRTVLALRYARSALGHHLFPATTTGGGLTFPVSFPLTFDSYPVWVAIEDLPDFGQNRQAAIRKHYVDRLAGRRVTDTLDQAADWFNRECARPGR